MALMTGWVAPIRAAKPPVDRHGDPLPAGAVSRLGSTRFLHSESVYSLAFSPDGSTLVSCAGEPFFRICDATSGREVRRFEVKGSTVNQVTLSPNGRFVASSDSDHNITVWDAITGKRLFSEHFDAYSTPVWAPDGKVLAIARQDGVIHLLNTRGGETPRTFEKAPEEGILPSTFSPDGKLLLGSGSYKPACVWDAATGKFLRRLEGNSDSAGCLPFSPDGKTVAGDCSYPLGRGATRSTFRLWDVSTGKKIRDLPAWTVNCAAFSPDGKIVAAGDSQHLIRLMDPATGKVLREWRAHEHLVTALAFSRDGKVLASAGSDQRIRLWDPATGEELRPTPGHRGSVRTMAFAPDGRTVVSGSLDRTIRFWDWSSGREWSRGEDIGDDWGASAILYSPDGKSLVSLETVSASPWGAREVIRLWDPSTGKMLTRPAIKGVNRIWSITFLADNQTLVLALEAGSIGLWQPATGVFRRLPTENDKGVATLVSSPDGKNIAWANGKQWFGIRDLATGEDRHTFKNPRYFFHVALAFSTDGTVLATAGGNAVVSVWDVATGRQLYALKNDRIEGDHSIRGLAFSPDGSIIATAEFREVRLWDLRTRKLFRQLTGHQGQVNAVAFAPDGRTLVSASDDGTLLVWDMTGRLEAGRLAAVALKPEELEKQWRNLGDTDGETRWRAVWTLAACPQSTSFLSTKLQPIPSVTAERLKQLVTDLDNDAFAVREKASRQLAEIGEVAGPALRQALASNPSPEVRGRIEALLKPLQQLDAIPPPEERLRVLSGLTVLEYVGDKEAKNLLRSLASGAPQARQTREAKAALARLTKRPLPPP
jgi:WD40 repeat protein